VELPEVAIERADGPGGWWEMAYRDPHPALDGYLGPMCGYEEDSPTPLCRREAPNGRVTLIIGLGDPIEIRQMSSSPTPYPGRVTSFVAGLHEGFALVESRRQHGIQLDLTPLGAYRLLGLPMSEIANSIVALDDLRGPATVELAERLAGTPDWAERFALIDRLLLGWADEGAEPDRAVSWAWNQLARTDGRAAVGSLAEEIGWSRRHFTSRFRHQVGLAPKPTARVLRFRRAAELLLAAGPGTTITDVSVAAGYADHSHMTREFQSLAGCTPSSYLKSQLDGGVGIAAA
jgi:AraC-like DNA-binding protein